LEEEDEVSPMQIMTFGVKSEREALREFVAAVKEAQKGLPRSGPKEVAYFTSLAAVRNFLTPKRLELLHLIKSKNPESIYSLAKSARRSFPSVLKDVELLSRHGLIKLTKKERSPRRSIRARVSYDAIHLYIGV